MRVSSARSGRVLQRVVGWYRGATGSGRDVALACLAGLLLYRARLGYLLYTSHVTPGAFDPDLVPPAYLLRHLLLDLAFALLAGAAAGAVAAALGPLVARPPRLRKLARGTGHAAAGLLLLLLGLDLAVHLKLLFLLHAGLTVDLLTEAWDALPGALIWAEVGVWEAAIILFPTAVYAWLRYRAAARTAPDSNRALALVILALVVPNAAVLLYGLTVDGKFSLIPPVVYQELGLVPHELALPPPAFTLRELRAGSGRGHLPEVLPGAEQMRSVALVDPSFVRAAPPAGAPGPREAAAAASPPWNVVLVILESVGAEYAFDSAPGAPAPMPFLRRLAAGGLTLGNHYASANSSHRAIFSILTGLYPRPGARSFEALPDLRIPTLNRMLGPGYDAWLVTPGRLDWYFPKALLEANGFRSLEGYGHLPEDAVAERNPYGRSEISAMSLFLRRLGAAREPFFAVYYSFAAHIPYADHGPEYRIRPDTTDRRHRYYNNLHVLDRQLRRLHDHLAATGLLDRTVLVVIGDHGEALGQHPGVWGHTSAGYEENFRVPVVIHQPRLFAPARTEVPTSHVDLAPTLLDAMGLSPGPFPLQGESVLRPERLRRKYIFLFTPRVLGAISRDRIKLWVKLSDARCWTHDLRRDPLERHPEGCESHREQESAVLKFAAYQRRILSWYNGRLATGAPPDTTRRVTVR